MSFKSVILYSVVIIFLIVLNNIRKVEMEKAEMEMQDFVDSKNNDHLSTEIDSLDTEIIKVSNQILLLDDESKK